MWGFGELCLVIFPPAKEFQMLVRIRIYELLCKINSWVAKLKNLCVCISLTKNFNVDMYTKDAYPMSIA